MGQRLSSRGRAAVGAAVATRQQRSSLSLLTWNIWFGRLAEEYRWAAISNVSACN